MNMPARAVEIIHALFKANPQDDAARRVDIQKVGEQLVFELGRKWGNKKRAGFGDEFRSPDSVAYDEDNGTVSVWDVQTSAGVITVFEGKGPDHPFLPPSEAAFIPCEPVNHLGVAEPDEPDQPENPGPVDLGPVLAAIAALDAKVQALVDRPAPPIDLPPVTVTFPNYEGSAKIPYFGSAPITLRPK